MPRKLRPRLTCARAFPTAPRRYEKLQRWDDALRAYQRKLESTAPGSAAHVDALLGQCRCLAALAEWNKLFDVCRTEWVRVEPYVRREMAPIAAHASWQLGEWKAMRQYVDVVNHGAQPSSAEGAFLSAVINIKNAEHHAAAGACTLRATIVRVGAASTDCAAPALAAPARNSPRGARARAAGHRAGCAGGREL